MSIIKVEGVFMNSMVGSANPAENHYNFAAAQPLIINKIII